MEKIAKYVGVGLIVLFFLWAVTLEPAPYDSTDEPPQRSGMTLHTDALTGCQYLGLPSGGLTPRMDSTHRQICRR